MNAFVTTPTGPVRLHFVNIAIINTFMITPTDLMRLHSNNK